jgi:hypothetical protein
MSASRLTFSAGLAALAFAMLTGAANAQVTEAEKNAMRANCGADFVSHCPGIEPAGKEALVCLQKNIASLSPGCQTAVKETMAKPAEASAPPPAAPAPQPAAAPPMKATAAPAKKEPAATAAPAKPTAAEQEAMRAACRSDFISHCSGVTPGGKEALVCLQRNVAELSPNCKTAVSATMGTSPAPTQAKAAPGAPMAPPAAGPAGPTPQQLEAIKANCRRDYRRNCRGIPPGGPEALACLVRNTARLRPACQASVAAISAPAAPAAAIGAKPTPQQLEAVKINCRRDYRRDCRGIPPGGPEALECLVRNTARLRPACRASVAAVTQKAPAAAAPPAPVIPIARIEAIPLRERLAIVRACDREAATVCPSVDAGGGRLIICLASHPAALSPRCGRILARALR